MSKNSDIKILVVDDSEPILDLLVDILSDKYDVRVATSGEAALLMLARSPVDLVLLDVVMSGMDGLEVCRRLHRGPLGETIPVIFLTALSDEATECAGLKAGAVDFIAKPINRDLVLARVANHVELKRHRDHLGALVIEKTRDLKRALVLMLETEGAVTAPAAPAAAASAPAVAAPAASPAAKSPGTRAAAPVSGSTSTPPMT